MSSLQRLYIILVWLFITISFLEQYVQAMRAAAERWLSIDYSVET